MTYRISFFLCWVLMSCICLVQANETVITDKELQASLNEVREEYKVPGIAVALVESNRPTRFVFSGFANLEQRQPVDEQTQFRFGSVGKVLVTMSIMKLVEQERLSLNSQVRELVPEITFINPWSAEHPVTVHHLLNHTTGWDGMHFAENLPQKNSPISVQQALALHPHSRESRWPPGSRYAYNNTGPLVAAYIVEKLSGTSFEAYVKQHFFNPLTMNSCDYFFTDKYRKHGATLYLNGQALDYAHLNNRPAGGLNSSVSDMGKLVRFLLTQGRSDNRVLAEQAITAMQTPSGSVFTQAGVDFVYAQGLNLYHANGWVLYGHEGAVRGGSAEIMYQPQLGKGFVIAINGEGPARAKLHNLLADMITRSQVAPVEPQASQFNQQAQSMCGLYRVINPGSELTALFSGLLPWRFTVTESEALIGPIFGMKPRQLGALGERTFSQLQTGKSVLVTNQDKLVGDVIHYGPLTLKRVTPLQAYAPLILLLLWLIVMLIGLVFAAIWLPRLCLGKITNAGSIRLRSWSLAPALLFIVAIAMVLYAKSSPSLFTLVGQPSWLSIALFAQSLGFLVVSMHALYVWWNTSKADVKPLIYYYCTMFIFLNMSVAVYLLINGLIGVRLWA
ncbi:serine hydrolase domain-containing protein [Pseudoalteromonas sp. T1lg48]|uniref:serine hydrolase domain-containing protein n=1 Tax=Pseudoalteromonas sp. T1lg48 TaxID=2077100 RepID=UPI000CF601D3|nr:serine hydrolase domain-containing protein [Pseudoalteromonas sp. T1lg48]